MLIVVCFYGYTVCFLVITVYVDAGKRNLENIARDIMRDMHANTPSG